MHTRENYHNIKYKSRQKVKHSFISAPESSKLTTHLSRSSELKSQVKSGKLRKTIIWRKQVLRRGELGNQRPKCQLSYRKDIRTCKHMQTTEDGRTKLGQNTWLRRRTILQMLPRKWVREEVCSVKSDIFSFGASWGAERGTRRRQKRKRQLDGECFVGYWF